MICAEAAFSNAVGADVYFKLENRQHTGSFKLRGATNRILSLSAEDRRRGIVAASSGNHGAAVACAAAAAGASALVYVAEGVPAAKLEAIRSRGGEVRTHGSDCVEAETAARRECLQAAGLLPAGTGRPAVAKVERSYQHVDPVLIGNESRLVVSELGGRANTRIRAEQLGHSLEGVVDPKVLSETIKELENQGLAFEGAEASFELLIMRRTEGYEAPFEILDYTRIELGPAAKIIFNNLGCRAP